jgi:hypothetical protein
MLDRAAHTGRRGRWRRAVAVVVVATTAAPFLVAPPAGAAEPRRSAPTASADPAEGARPAGRPADRDGDGLGVSRALVELDRSVEVELRHDEHEDDGHEDNGHADHVMASGRRVATPTRPEMLIIEQLDAGTHLALRTRTADGWDDWFDVASDEFEAPDGLPGQEGHDRTAGVGPIWLGNGVEEVELAVLDGELPEVELTKLHLEEPSATADDGPAGVRGLQFAASTSTTAGIKPRSSWATSDMGWACSSGPSTSSELRAVVVHHTAGSNTYDASQVPGIIRAIWYYHVKTRGWCDIAYNFLVDRYGGMWEGRQGGIEKAIIGGHTYGFNTSTSGVSQIGDFQAGSAPYAMTQATKSLVGWKLARHGVEPSGTTKLVNRSGSTINGVPDGGSVTVPKIVGHRDLGTTSCPGSSTYTQLPAMRTDAKLGAHLYAVHRTFLRRRPTPAEYSHWMWRARSEGLTATTLEMARSEAYAGLIITDLFQRVLGRAPDAEGMAYWLDVLAGGTSVETVGVYFYGSAEYYSSYATPEDYVASLYEDLLHRDPEPNGLRYWAGQIRAGMPPAGVAHGFYASIESRRDRVTRLYRSILGRDPDAAGREYWAERLAYTDDIVLAVDLAMTTEYYEKHTS